MKALKRLSAFLFCILIFAVAACRVGAVKSYPVVTDLPDVLSDETTKYITQKNAALCDKTGGRIYVYITSRIENENVLGADYAHSILEQIGAGMTDPGKDETTHGVWAVIVIESDSGNYYFEHTSGDEKLISKIEDTVRKCLKAPLSKEDLDEDVSYTVERLADVFYDHYGVEEPDYTAYSAQAEEDALSLEGIISSLGINYSQLIIIAVVVIFIVLFIAGKASKNN